MRRREPTLTRQELAVMKIVWREGPVTVRDVYETLRLRRPIAYTTVMTVMNILNAKGYLSRNRQNRAYVYEATQPQRQVVRGMVREFVNRVFDGASAPLLLQLVRESRLTRAERDELLQLIKGVK